MKTESTETQMQTPVRRTCRKSLPNSAMMFRRQMMRERFLNTPDTAIKRKKVVPSKIERNVTRALRYARRIKSEIDENGVADRKPIEKSDLDALKTEFKQEDDDPLLEIPETFIITKAAGITSTTHRDIQPTYFPSEDENSGVIIFKSNSRRAVLKISYAKCFVILNGIFSIDEQGEFSNGDFIKAPAGSRLGIKYLGGSGDCGKIIFFKSVS